MSIKKRLALFEDKASFTNRLLKCSNRLPTDSVWRDIRTSPLIQAQAYIISLSSVTDDLCKVKFSYNDNFLIYDSSGNILNLHGVVTFENGFSCFVTTSYDPSGYENSIVYILYYDGIKWRGYIPVNGNSYNHETNEAYDISESDEVKPNWNMIKQDIIENIRPRNGKPRQLKLRYNS